MPRWPNVEGLQNWDDIAVFRQEKIEADVPEQDIDRWIDLVFGYTIVLPWSPVNVAGVNAFLEKHTFGFDGWDEFVQKKYQLAREGKLKKRSLGPKSPWAQPGDLKYRLEKGEYCEYCPQEDGVPRCATNAQDMGFTQDEYFEGLDVNHWDGDHLSKNIETLCANVHRAFTKRYGHAKNLNQREAK